MVLIGCLFEKIENRFKRLECFCALCGELDSRIGSNSLQPIGFDFPLLVVKWVCNRRKSTHLQLF